VERAWNRSRAKLLSEKGKREMSLIRAIVVDPEIPGRLSIKEVKGPQPGPSEALVQVEAISLNRGEVLGAIRILHVSWAYLEVIEGAKK